MSVYQRLESLSIKLPAVAPPVAAFVPFVRSGRLVFLSGHIAKKDGAPWVGQLGAGVDVEQGKLAARAVAVDLLATLHAATGRGRHAGRRQSGNRQPALCLVRRHVEHAQEAAE